MSNKRYGDESLLTPHEVAYKLSVSKATVDRWMRTGKIPAVPHPLGRGRGRRIYFDWPSVAKALKIRP